MKTTTPSLPWFPARPPPHAPPAWWISDPARRAARRGMARAGATHPSGTVASPDVPAAHLLNDAAESALPPMTTLLHAAVTSIGGAERPGQVTMARAVEHAIETERTPRRPGRAPVPASRWPTWSRRSACARRASADRGRVHRDDRAPAPARRPGPAPARRGADAVLGSEPDVRDPQGRAATTSACTGCRSARPRTRRSGLFEPAVACRPLGRQVQRLHEWAGETETGDRDELVPGVSDQAWRQLSVSAQGMPRRASAARTAPSASRRRRGPRRARPTSWSPTMRCWPSTPSATTSPARARRDRDRRGARTGRPGHLGGHRRAVAAPRSRSRRRRSGQVDRRRPRRTG